MSCPDCVKGYVHTGTPTGTEIKVGGVDAYAVGPEDAARVIIIGADIFGWKFVNTRLLADEYAARGFRVIVPDLFNGTELPQWSLVAHDPMNSTPTLFQRFVAAPASYFALVPFVLRNLPRQISTITTITAAVRAWPVSPKVGFVGFCWGGRFAISLNHLFDASAACHPSLVRFPSELSGITGPFSLAVAATDSDYNATRAKETEKILGEKSLEHVEVRVYEGVNHGWTTRADLNDEVQKKARDDAMEQVVGWFEKHLIPTTSGGEAAPAH